MIARLRPDRSSKPTDRRDAWATSFAAPLGPGVPLAYVCGPTSLVEAVASALVDVGVPPERVLTEGFVPTGGAT